MKIPRREAAGFALAGAAAYLADLATFLTLRGPAALPPLPAKTLSFLVGCTVAYLGNALGTYRDRVAAAPATTAGTATLSAASTATVQASTNATVTGRAAPAATTAGPAGPAAPATATGSAGTAATAAAPAGGVAPASPPVNAAARAALHRYATFFAVNLAGAAVQLLCLGFAHYVLGLASARDDVVSGLGVGMALATALRFWGTRTLVFGPRPAPAGASVPAAGEGNRTTWTG